MLENVSRRGFLQGLVGTGAFVLGGPLFLNTATAEDEQGSTDAEGFSPDLFLAIGTTGLVTIVAHRSEMGTGIRTSLPLVVADELGASWDQVAIEQAIGDAAFGSQNTDGSRSIRRFFDRMRQAGATARVMLAQAAAQIWKVPVAEVSIRDHAAHHTSGKTLGFGELVETARTLEVPPADTLTFKPKEEWRYIGKKTAVYDNKDLVTGQGVFGQDLSAPGMVYAVIERPPVLSAKLESAQVDAAKQVPGVLDVIVLDSVMSPPLFKPLGGVAVIAKNTWAALQGRRALKAQWKESPHSAFDSVEYEKTLTASSQASGKVIRDDGDAPAALKAAGDEAIAADYYIPLLAHASMEPPAALASVTKDGCEAWAPTQNPQAAQDTLSRVLGLKKEQVTVHVSLLGGGFGRKSKGRLRGRGGGPEQAARQAGEGGLDPGGRHPLRLLPLGRSGPLRGRPGRGRPAFSAAGALSVPQHRDDLRPGGPGQAGQRHGAGPGPHRQPLRGPEPALRERPRQGPRAHRLAARGLQHLPRVRPWSRSWTSWPPRAARTPSTCAWRC